MDSLNLTWPRGNASDSMLRNPPVCMTHIIEMETGHFMIGLNFVGIVEDGVSLTTHKRRVRRGHPPQPSKCVGTAASDTGGPGPSRHPTDVSALVVEQAGAPAYHL